jgi:hypothetical protein
MAADYVPYDDVAAEFGEDAARRLARRFPDLTGQGARRGFQRERLPERLEMLRLEAEGGIV